MKRFLIPAVLFFLTAHTALAQTPAVVPKVQNFQGRLAKPDGTPVPNGTYELTFRLFAAASGGSSLWKQNNPVIAVRNGVFATKLDFSTNYAAGQSYDSVFSAARYLEIQVGGDTPLTPRQQFAANAFAFRADQANVGLTVPDGSLTASKFVGGVLTPGGTAGGDLTGTYPNPQIRAGAVGHTELADDVASLFHVSDGRLFYSYGTNADQGSFVSNNNIGDFAWQSFTPSYDGYMTFVTFRISVASGAHNVTVRLYQGEGVGGALLATSNIRLVTDTTPTSYSFNFATPPLLNGGSPYTIYASGDSTTRFYYQNSNVYPGGRSDFSSNSDYYFGTNMSWQQDNANLNIKSQVIISPITGYYTNATFGVYGIFGDAVRAQSINDKGVNASSDNNDGIYTTTGNANAYAIFAAGKSGGTQNWVMASDKRYKQNVKTYPDALEAVRHLRGVTFDWKQNEFPQMQFDPKPQVGFIAQEIEKVLPSVVSTDKNGYKSVAYSSVVPVLVEAIKTQQKQIEALQKQIQQLQNARRKAKK